MKVKQNDKIVFFAFILLAVFIVGGGILRTLYIMQMDHVATDDELLMISRRTPCAVEEFSNALTPSDHYHSKPLTIRNAHRLASKCMERNEEITWVNEKNYLTRKQLKALDEILTEKEGLQRCSIKQL